MRLWDIDRGCNTLINYPGTRISAVKGTGITISSDGKRVYLPSGNNIQVRGSSGRSEELGGVGVLQLCHVQSLVPEQTCYWLKQSNNNASICCVKQHFHSRTTHFFSMDITHCMLSGFRRHDHVVEQ